MFSTATELGQLLHYNGFSVTWLPEPGGDDYIHAVYVNDFNDKVERRVEAWFKAGTFSKAVAVNAFATPTPITYLGADLLSSALGLYPISDFVVA